MSTTRFLESDDKKYLFFQQADNNFVVYLADGMVPLWDRFSYEATQESPPPASGRPPAPGPVAPSPTVPPAVGGGRLYRVTGPEDGIIPPRQYSYWSNAWVNGDDVYVFTGKRGDLPQFFRVKLSTGDVSRLGPLLQYGGESEGWSWDLRGWIYLIDGPRYLHVNPFGGETDVVYDISDVKPGHDLWQPHSSDDGQTHSATVRHIQSGAYPHMGTMVCRRGDLQYFAAIGELDESILTKDGAYLVIQEKIEESEDNRVVVLATGEERRIRDKEGAVGHCDTGDSLIIGEDNQHGACVRWDLQRHAYRELFSTWGMGHLSVRQGVCLRSDGSQLSLVDRQTGVQTPLLAHGATVLNPNEPYDDQVKANLSPCARVACFMSNFGSDRRDVYLLTMP